MVTGLVVDLFAGGGGASTGIEAALGRPVDHGVNHDPIALAAHKANHPHTKHHETSVWDIDPLEVTGGQPVALLWASPDCTHFSVAKGAKPRSQKIRSLAWVVVRWAKKVQPAVICVENVQEFRGWGPLDKATKKPIKARMGETFRAWRRKLERLGYAVDYRILDASEYGAPTRRRRLFIVARRDGRPIVWPGPTHGKGRLPLRTAAECIDWSLACPSIFERVRPLRPKTLWRIAQGIRRFVIENPQPFIVGVGGRAGQSGPTGMGQPVGTVTTKNDRALVEPFLVRYHGERRAGESARVESLGDPLPTQTTENRFGLIAPHLVKFRHDSAGAPVDEPMPTITAGNGRPDRPAGAGHALGIVAPTLVEMNHSNHPRSVEDPLGSVTTQHNRFNLAAATLVQTGYGEREGQAARVPGLDKPLGTVVAGGQKHALVSAFIAKHFGDRGQRPGSGIDEPLATITSSDHNSLAAATLIKLRGQCHGSQLELPLPTITSGGTHYAEVRAFLTAYYSNDGNRGKGQRLDQPLRTVSSKDHIGLVVVEGLEYLIVDIGMRMLQPEELLRAQFGRFAPTYDLSAARTKAAKVRLIGNSVPPEVAEAVVRSNVRLDLPEPVAA